MTALTLQNKPVVVGTELKYRDDWLSDEHDIVGNVKVVYIDEEEDGFIEYEGVNAGQQTIEGSVRRADIDHVFDHVVKEYELVHITDLMNIPADRLNAALDELKVMVPLMRAALEAEKQVRTERGLENDAGLAERAFPTVTWLDDGSLAEEITINGEPAIKVTVHKQG